jgi:hypothetical protein
LFPPAKTIVAEEKLVNVPVVLPDALRTLTPSPAAALALIKNEPADIPTEITPLPTIDMDLASTVLDEDCPTVCDEA